MHKTIATRVDLETYKVVNDLAEQSGLNKSDFLRKILFNHLEKKSNLTQEITQKEFDADKFAPEEHPDEVCSYYVVCCDTGNEIFFDYNEKTWTTFKGVPVTPMKWRYPKPIALQDEREPDTKENLIESKYKLLAETFEEFISDRGLIKELKDFWRKRAGLPTTE